MEGVRRRLIECLPRATEAQIIYRRQRRGQHPVREPQLDLEWWNQIDKDRCI
jgi:hypothetical protein